MSSRYPPPARDRSPPRYERRPSSTAFTPSSQRDPPRGPKADFRGGGNFGGNFPTRGRGGGFTSRPNDTWDRERERDRPAAQSYRVRDDDRAEWPRRDRDFPPIDRSSAATRETRPYVGRERSASPIRSRRDSRESVPSTFSRLPDSASSYYAPASRGGITRGRGRGDWDRGRGRNSFVGERGDLFQPRSRSRESWRDRDFDRGRPPPSDTDRSGGYDRRDYDRSREREVRGRDTREHDIWQRNISPARNSTLNTGAPVTTPSTSINDRPGKLELDAGRRASVVATPVGAVRDGRRDGESTDYFGSSRLDSSRREPSQLVQQPPAAVGLDYGPPPSLSAPSPAAEKPAVIKPQPPKPEGTYSAPFQPPSGPKAGRTIGVQGVPSGPRISNVPPSAPREPHKPAGSPPAPIIPTGPRGMQNPIGKQLWGPSITESRAGFLPLSHRLQSNFPNQPQKSRVLHAFGSPVTTAVPSGPKALTALSPKIQEAKMTLLPPRKHLEQSQDADMSASASTSASSADEAEDDSFDEEYFAESEERHKQEMKLLETRKPPVLFEDPIAVALLVKLQFLEMISRETAPRPAKIADEISKEESVASSTVPHELPVLEEPPVDTHPQQDVRRRPLKEPPVNPIPTPPIESLPYLKEGPPERVVFDESDNEVEHEAVATLLQQEFEREAWDWGAELEEQHADFKFKYSVWKHEINQMEQERREQQASPAPASPAPSVAPSVTPSLAHERTRGARNTTEADLEAALLLSKQSAKEEEERREREAAASSLPNFDMEAVIPPMLTAAELELSQFEDTNNLIPQDMVKHAFAYWPPVDDFIDKEQELFISAYCQTPKKWSKIAESIPGRTYQDCITHYYLTKDQVRYKEILKRSQPKRRRGKAAIKPRSTALLSELQRGGDDVEGTPLAVTDSGRPRRAAAPTFGDVPSEVDPLTPLPQSKKLTAAWSNPDNTAVKTSRGRKTGSGTKIRRTKAQIQADQQQALLLAAAEASPGKPTATGKAERGRTLLRVGDALPSKADLPAIQQAQRLVEAGLQQYPGPEPPSLPALAQAATASSVTSYWSVPEQHKFPDLLAYFGRDFAAIADFMKTKSVTMIKNYYLRQLNDGKDEFEKIAQGGEQRRMAGEVIPQPPSPIAPAKRRYDTTPSIAPGGRGPIQPDQLVVDSDSVVPVIKPSMTDEYPQGTLERSVMGDVVAKPRSTPREAPREVPPPPGPLVTKTEEVGLLSNDRIPLFGQKPHGPRAGIFQDDVGLQASRQAFRPHLQERSPQILAQRLPELARNEMAQQSNLAISARSLLGQREPMIPSTQRNQIPSAASLSSLQPQAEKYPQPNGMHPGHHSRNSSLVTPSHSVFDSPQELSSLRRVDHPRPLFGSAMAGSPALKAMSVPVSQRSRAELLQPGPAPVAPEPSKPPVKRSNVFGLLNDDPPVPPPKRPSLETQKRSSIMSPQMAPIPPAQMPLQQPRSQLHEDPLIGRMSRGPFGHSSTLSAGGGQQTLAEYPSSFSTPPVTAPSNETWMDRFDPRTQGTPGEHRGHRHSPAPSQYSLVPPGSQPPSLHAMRVEASRGLERSGMEHHRSLLGQMNQTPHVPSPPPQQATQPVPPLRSASSSSQHSRGPSLGYISSQQASQSSSLGHGAVAQTHAQSASSTSVPSLHRTHSSIDFPTRLTIQQHMAQQTHQKQQEQHREHERQIQRQRELEVAAQRDRERERDREHQQQHMRRDIYGIEHHSAAISRQNQLGATANQSHMPFSQREISRTFTPPHTHGHSHSHSHSQFGGHGPIGLGGTPGLQHGLQHSLQHQQQPGMPPLHPGLQHTHHPQLHPSGHPGHFRGASQGDARRDGR